jgi:pimeloyl-ACP methyl ester carboxylesterase
MSPDLSAWLAAGRFLPWRGQRVFVAQTAARGAGHDTLLLLHGYPTGSFDWAPLWPELSRHARLLAPDFLGLGFSDKPLDGGYRVEDHADQVEDLLHSQGVARCRLLAHDLGVSVAQELLARQRQGRLAARIERVAFLNGGLCPAAYRPRLIQRLLASPLGPWLAPRVSRRAFDGALRRLFALAPPPGLLDDFWALLEHQQGRRIAHLNGRFWRDRLTQQARLLQPLLAPDAPPLRLVWGMADPNSGRAMAEAFQRLKPDADLVALEGVGHWPQVEAPDAVLSALRPFLFALVPAPSPSTAAKPRAARARGRR